VENGGRRRFRAARLSEDLLVLVIVRQGRHHRAGGGRLIAAFDQPELDQPEIFRFQLPDLLT
jgi:hypothetical protein